MEEIKDLIMQIDFNNLTYRCKGNTAPKSFRGFKGPLVFCKNIKGGYITLEKAEEGQTESKLEIKEIVIGSKNQKIKKMQ